MISLIFFFITSALYLLYFAITGEKIEIENTDRIAALCFAELFLELFSIIIYTAWKLFK